MKKIILFILAIIVLISSNLSAQHCLYFDGGDAATIVSTNLLGAAAGDPFTIEAWVYYDGSIPEDYTTIFSSESDIDDKPFFGVVNQKLVLNVLGDIVKADAVFPANRWVHAAVTYDGADAKLYMDGVMIKSAASPNLDVTAVNYYYWGWSTGDTQWKGYIDEMIIWNEARTEAEINADMVKESLGGTETNLAVYFDLNEGTGQTLNNKVSGGPDGVLGDGGNPENDDPTWSLSFSPGGVWGSNMWLDANNGVTNTGTDLTGWTELTGTNTFATVGAPGYGTDEVNFNPSVSFYNTNPVTELPPKRLDGNTAITTKEGFAILKNNSSINSTLIGSTVSGTNHGLSLFNFTIDEQTIISASNGTSFQYKGFQVFESIVDHRIVNLDIGGTPGTGRVNSVFYPLDEGNGTFTSLSITPMVGGTNNGTGGGGEGPFNGEVSEIIFFPTSLSDADRNRIESYLAVKYGIHKTGNYVNSSGTTLWDAAANATYHNDVFGIGKDYGSELTQSSSNSYNSGSGDGTGQLGKGNIVLTSPSSLDNGDFLMIGHDNTVITNQYTDMPPGLSNQARITREWKVKHTGDAGTVSISFEVEGLPILGEPSIDDPTYYNILIDEDGNGDFTDGTVTIVNPTSIDGLNTNFSGITLNDGVVFTFSMRLSNTWQGDDPTNPTDWSVRANWESFVPPGPTDDVTIPSGLKNYPIIGTLMKGDDAAKCFNLNVEDGASVTVNGELIMTGN